MIGGESKLPYEELLPGVWVKCRDGRTFVSLLHNRCEDWEVLLYSSDSEFELPVGQ